jgi:hypothetical protein
MVMTMWRSDRVLVAVHDSKPPSEDEWARWIELCSQPPGGERLVMVETHGGGPDAKQRKALAEATADGEMRAAVMTDSLVARGILTALVWLGVPVRPFGVYQHRSAAEYLGLSADEQRTVLEVLRRLRNEAGLHDPL